MYNYYRNTAVTKSILENLPAFVTKDIDSNFYKLLNPYGIFSESLYFETISTMHQINPMTVDYGLAASIYSVGSIPQEYHPHTPSYTLTESSSLKDFNEAFPSDLQVSSIQDFGVVTNPNQGSTNGAGENIADFHYLSPLNYLDDDGLIQTLDEGFITVHEGIYISDNLINIYDRNFNHVKAVTLSTIAQRGSDLVDDEWIEQDDLVAKANGDYKYYPKHHCITTISKVLVPTVMDANGSAIVIDPSHYALSYEYDAWGKPSTCVTFDPTVTDGASNSFDITNIQLIIEYDYFPSKVLGGVTFLADYHSVLASNKLNANPLSFVTLPNTFYQFNGSGTQPQSYDNTTQYLWTDSEVSYNVTIQEDESTYSTPTLTSKLTLNGHEAREGLALKEQDLYDLKLTEQFTFNPGNQWKYNTGTFEIDSLGEYTITVNSTDGTDEASDFRVNLNVDGDGNNDGLLITRPGDTTATTTITVVAAIKAIQLDGLSNGGSIVTVEKYDTSYEETVTVAIPGATESFYLSYPVHSAPSIDVGSGVVWTDMQKLITIDTSTLTAGDLITVTYDAYTKTYNKDERVFFSSMSTRTVDIPGTYANCEYLGRTVSVIKPGTGCKSLAWYKRFIHIEENSFLQSLLSLDMADNSIHLYNSNNDLLDVKLLSASGSKVSVDSSATESSDYWQTTVANESAVCIRTFENAIIVLYKSQWSFGDDIIDKSTAGAYRFAAYNLDTLEELWSENVTIIDYKVTSFTIDKDHKIHAIGTDGVDTKVFTYEFRYDYYYCFPGLTGYKDYYFYYDYQDLVFRDESNVPKLYHISQQEPQATFTTAAIADVTAGQDYTLTVDAGDIASNVAITSVTASTAGIVLPADYSATTVDSTTVTLSIAANSRHNTRNSQTTASGNSATAETIAWEIPLTPDAGDTNVGSLVTLVHNTTQGADLASEHYIVADDKVTILANNTGEVVNNDVIDITWEGYLLVTNGETFDVEWTTQSNDFNYTNNITEFSTDQFGRAIGSDRWYGEKGTDYLDRLVNITTAKGNVTTEGAIAGISATYNATAYKLNSNNQFALRYAVKSGEAANVKVTLNGTYNWWTQSLESGTALTYSSDGITNHFTVTDTSTTGIARPILTIINTNSVAVDSNGEIAVEVIYTSNQVDPNGDNIVVTDTFTYTSYTQPMNFDDIITVDDLSDAEFIASHVVERNGVEATGIYSKELIKYLKKGGANFKFKWDEFEWDRYEWADGTSIRRGLPTYFDGITCKPSETTDNADQMFDNGVSGMALKYLGKNEDGRPRIALGNFYYLDTEYSLYNNPVETIIDVANYPSGTWNTTYHTPLVYFEDEDLDGQADGPYDVPVYFQPGSAAPVVVDDVVANAAMTVAAGDNGLNTMQATFIELTCTKDTANTNVPAENLFAEDAEGNHIYEVWYKAPVDTDGHHVLIHMSETTDYTIDIAGGTLTSILDHNDASIQAEFPGVAETNTVLLVYNSATYVNSYLVTDRKPENSLMRTNRLNSINYADVNNSYQKTLGQDPSKLYEEYLFSELTNPYNDGTLEQIITHPDNDTPVSTTFRLRDPATGNIDADRPWLTNDWDDSTTDLRVYDPTVAYRFLCDTSHEDETIIRGGDGPSLNFKFNNIGNSILVVGRDDGIVTAKEVFTSKTLVDETDSYFVFVKLTDSEHGRISGKDVKVVASIASGSISTNEATGVTQEDGIAVIEISHIISGGSAGTVVTLTVSAVDTNETWSATAELIQTET